MEHIGTILARVMDDLRTGRPEVVIHAPGSEPRDGGVHQIGSPCPRCNPGVRPYYCYACGKWTAGETSYDMRGNKMLGCPIHADQRYLVDYSRSAD